MTIVLHHFMLIHIYRFKTHRYCDRSPQDSLSRSPDSTFGSWLRDSNWRGLMDDSKSKTSTNSISRRTITNSNSKKDVGFDNRNRRHRHGHITRGRNGSPSTFRRSRSKRSKTEMNLTVGVWKNEKWSSTEKKLNSVLEVDTKYRAEDLDLEGGQRDGLAEPEKRSSSAPDHLSST